MEKAACVLRVEIQSIMLYSRQRVSEKHHEYIDDRSGAESLTNLQHVPARQVQSATSVKKYHEMYLREKRVIFEKLKKICSILQVIIQKRPRRGNKWVTTAIFRRYRGMLTESSSCCKKKSSFKAYLTKI